MMQAPNQVAQLYVCTSDDWVSLFEKINENEISDLNNCWTIVNIILLSGNVSNVVWSSPEELEDGYADRYYHRCYGDEIRVFFLI